MTQHIGFYRLLSTTRKIHPATVMRSHYRIYKGYVNNAYFYFFSVAEMPMSALIQIPRGHFYVLSEEAITLFNVSKAEVKKAIRLGFKLLPQSSTPPGSKNFLETSLGFRTDSLKKTKFV